jgi:transposase
LRAATRAELEQIASRPSSQQRLAQRSQLVLALDEAGDAVHAVTDAFAVTAATVRKWARRIAEHGTEGLRDRHRSGCPRLYDEQAVQDLLATATSKPPVPTPAGVMPASPRRWALSTGA